jgi:hypothetical protein
MMNGSQKSLSLRLRSGQAPKSQRAIFFRMGHPLGGVFFEDRVNLGARTRASPVGRTKASVPTLGCPLQGLVYNSYNLGGGLVRLRGVPFRRPLCLRGLLSCRRKSGTLKSGHLHV